MDKMIKIMKIAFWWYYLMGTKQNCTVVIQMIRFNVQKNFEPKTNAQKLLENSIFLQQTMQSTSTSLYFTNEFQVNM